MKMYINIEFLQKFMIYVEKGEKENLRKSV